MGYPFRCRSMLPLTVWLLLGCAPKAAIQPDPPPAVTAPSSEFAPGPELKQLLARIDDPSSARRMGRPTEFAKRFAELLDAGELEQARSFLNTASTADRQNPVALMLVADFYNDPKARWPVNSFEHVLVREQSLGQIAECYLGSAYRFHALARYNDIAVPRETKRGTRIKIPENYRNDACRARLAPRPQPASAAQIPSPPPENSVPSSDPFGPLRTPQ